MPALIIALSAFCRRVTGLVFRPYETCRKIAHEGKLLELVYVGLILAFYFTLASLVKVAAFRPFLLTRQFFVLSGGAALTYVVAVGLLWGAGRLVGARVNLKGLAVVWGYSLLPTVIWFLATSLLYVILPPPRTTSWQGMVFSVVFLVFSVTLFFWKATMAYLAVRFAFRLSLGNIILVFAIVLPVLACYSVLMYRLGIFRVPFV